MTEKQRQIYLKRLGARILSEANDLKRTPEAMASELGLGEEVVLSVMRGESSLEDARSLAQRIADTYPVTLSKLWVEHDDTDDGVRVSRAADTKASSRIFDRPDRSGTKKPYYEYRDTAMSRNGPFKPEWIKELRVVTGKDPDNPDVAYNNGHLLHQVTFFIGPVNFYWQTNGKRHCAELNTGDSNFITPFVPHSFTSRDPDQPGLIVAVTFSAQVHRSLDELGALDPDDADALAGDMRDGAIFAVRLKRLMAEECLDERGMLDAMTAKSISVDRAQALIEGAAPTGEECILLARILSVQPRDLMAETMAPESDVVVQYRDTAPSRLYPSDNDPTYKIRPLARHSHQAHVKGFELLVLAHEGALLRHHLHQYVYNFGGAPTRLSWAGGRETILNPGDSAYFRPMVEHRFSRIDDEAEPRLVVIRVPGNLTQEAVDEYAGFNPERRSRAILETSRWF
jgi:quercetin dioxygenase-like cupin family protein